MNPNPQKSPNAENEEKILQFWNEQKIFEKTLEKDAPLGDYNFFEGPPTANGRPGIHHVAARSFKDVIPRYKTMRGFRVNRKAGWDTHGLPVELQVEKQLGLKSKKEIEAYGVEAFNKLCKESVWTYKEEWERLTERMGYWIDMKNPYVTYENKYIEALWATVKKIDERGHMYRDFKVLPWCTRCGTALSSHELNQPGAYREVKDLSVYVKFKVVGQENTYLLAWTTTPWTLPGNVALAINSDVQYLLLEYSDDQQKFRVIISKEGAQKLFSHDFVNDMRGTLISNLFTGKEENVTVVSVMSGSELVSFEYEPLFPHLKENISDDQKPKLENAFRVYAADFVTTTDGTGIVHIAPMYGADDFDVATKNNLPKFHTVTEEGKFIFGTDFLAGRYVKETDENGKPTVAVDIIDYLKQHDNFFKQENVKHPYPHCWRCDTPLLYYARTSWYFGVSKLRDQLVAANESINWEPDHIKEGRFGEWLDGIKDWAISRDRYWGTPIPVWMTESGKRVTIGGLDDLKKYAKKSGNTYLAIRHGRSQANELGNIIDSLKDSKYHLAEKGKEQVLAAVPKLKDRSIDLIVCSPLLRARETAETISQGIGYAGQIVLDDRLAETNPGREYQGQKWDDYWAQFKTYKDRYAAVCPDGENYNHVKNRVMDLLYEYEQKYAGKTILFVSHGGPIMNMILGSEGVSCDTIADDIETIAYPDNAEIREIDFVPIPHNENYELDFHKPYIDQVELELDGEKLTRTPEVMDVWFDSGTMPIAQYHGLGEPVNFDPKPADYIAEGVDQTRGWFYTMHAVANLLHDNPTQAYKNVVCMGLLMDANGLKMSKSKGNIVEPWAMFDKYGADVVRFWFYSVNQPGESKNFDEKSLDEVNKKVFNPLRNVVSFYDMYKNNENTFNLFESKNILDHWILALWNKTLRIITEGLEKYQPLEPSRAIREFINELSTWYIRRSRDRFKSENDSDKWYALATTEFILKNLSRAMAPFAPFIAEEIWLQLGNTSSVHLEPWPEKIETKDEEIEYMNWTREFITLGLEQRSRSNIKVRQPLSKISFGPNKGKDVILSENTFSQNQDLIKDELNLKQIVVDENLPEGTALLDTNITQELREEGIVRDMIRVIQDERKKAGLVPEDRPMLVVDTNDDGETFISKFKDEIAKKTGLSGIEFGDANPKEGESMVEAHVFEEEIGIPYQFEIRK